MPSKTKIKDSSQSFLKGALVLSISMIAVKICGLLQKVLLTNLYGTLDENYGAFGSALFANAYEIYVPLFTLATVGFPIAVSRLVSESYAKERYKDVRQVYRVAKPLFIVMGLVCFLLMTIGSFWYVSFINSPYSLKAMLVLAPTIFFGCLVSVYRGYFEGMRNMTPTAISEVIEAVSKIAIGVVLSYVVISVGKNEFASNGTIFGQAFSNIDDAYRTLISYSVAASIFGITMGSVLSFLYLRIRFALHKGDIPEEYYQNSLEAISKKATLVKMIKTALPVGIGALALSVSSTIDATIIQNLMYNMAINNTDALLAEFNHVLDNTISANPDEITIHTCIWGYYSASLTLISIVVAVTQVFGTSAMPNVTNAYTKGNREELKKSMETVLRLTTIVTFPCGIGLLVLAKPILSLVFFTDPNIAVFGYESLQVMGIAILFMGTLTPICSMLQGVGKVNHTMFIYLFGTGIKILVSFLFARIVSINIVGSAIGSLVSYFLMCTVALSLLMKYTKIVPNFVKFFLKPLLSAVICGGAAYLAYYVFSLHVIISIAFAAIIYLLALIILRTFDKSDVLALPKGKKFVIILEKLHLMS